ncbi:carboxymuconolactone decarboxylase family protein [Streptosporangium subroseum]|uniref:carboxymuconolactone decarboxylase family protein n=1 Tax=Streptosporangium subroseum TaxID=106412 RepID=UPI0030904612|nr:carboxymuconolactone decarboxylase family protein [Streptosporangium subroseum]
MTRIPCRDLDTLSGEARALSTERGALNVYRALANAEQVFTGWMAAGREHLTSRTLPTRLRELIILHVGHLMDSPYEVAQHTEVARQAGVSPAQLSALATDLGSGSAVFDDTELATLRLTTELITTKHVDAALFHRVHRALGTEATVELLMLVHRWAGLALMLNALQVDLDADARISIPPAPG